MKKRINLKRINLQYYKLEHKKLLQFLFEGVDNMNYFFKYLIPQLMEYFNNDKELLLEFLPKIIGAKYKNDIEIFMKEDEIIDTKIKKI